MAAIVTMPKLGLTMERGSVAAWRVREGDHVNLGAVIAEISTSKVVYELEAQAQGVLLKIIVPKDGEVEVGVAIALIGQPGEDISAFAGPDIGGGAPAAVPETLVEAEAAATVAEPESGTRVKASPAAKKLAAELGVDVTSVVGTGPGGRITQEDVTAAASAAPAPGAAAEAFTTPVAKKLAAELGVDLTGVAGSGPSGRIKAEDVVASVAPAPLPGPTGITDLRGGVAKQRPYTGLRRIVGEHMGASQKLSPTVTYYGTADVQELNELLARRFGTNLDADVLMTATVVRAAALTLEKMPRFNAALDGDVIKIWKNINVGVAVALSQGLVVPVIKEANRKGLSQIAGEIRDLAGRARENQLLLDEISGGTFTVSTLGPYRSVDFFSPIINQPEAAILGVGRIKDTVVAVDGVPVVRATMGLSLTCDHRLVDGGPSAEFLETLMDYLAQPLSVLV